MRPFQRLPGLNLIEDLEEQRAEEQLARRLRPIGVVLNFTDQILGDTIGCPERVRKTVSSQDRIIGPGARLIAQPSIVDCEPLGREAPVAIEDDGRGDCRRWP